MVWRSLDRLGEEETPSVGRVPDYSRDARQPGGDCSAKGILKQDGQVEPAFAKFSCAAITASS
jgi:hypothetical protein